MIKNFIYLDKVIGNEGRREGGREKWREGGREGRREKWREGGRDGGGLGRRRREGKHRESKQTAMRKLRCDWKE